MVPQSSEPASPVIERLLWSDPSRAELEARLTPAEQSVLAGWPAEKRRQDWLLGRIAAKQAVRAAYAREGSPPPDWTEVEVGSSEDGAPRLVIAGEPDGLAVSLTHGHGRAAGWALRPGEGGGLPGVDLEQVRPRRLGTLRFYLHEDERSWVRALPGSEVDPPPAEGPWTPRDLAAIVLWALKEAAFKALQPPRGTGLLDVAVELETPYDAERGVARVRYLGQAEERARRLGLSGVEAGWLWEDPFVLAWVLARDARLPR
jgi:phosphopantetheinyl transferase (holo-ACP synthase)